MGRSISAPGSVTFRSRSTISLPRLGSYRGEAQARPGGTAGWSGRAADLMAHRPGRLPHRVGGVAARARLWHHRGGLSLGGWDRPEGDLVTAGFHSDRIISGPNSLVVLATQMPTSRCCRVPWWILSLSRGGSPAPRLSDGLHPGVGGVAHPLDKRFADDLHADLILAGRQRQAR